MHFVEAMPRFAKGFVQRRTKKQYVWTLGTLAILLWIVAFVVPVRNFLLGYFVHTAWRSVGTMDLIRMHYIRQPVPQDGHFPVPRCEVMTTPPNRSSVNVSGVKTYDYLQRSEVWSKAVQKHHGRFLPWISLEQKVDVLHLYHIAEEVLTRRNIRYFLLAGSLLGLYRHGGFIPWDDDMDIGISVMDWRAVLEAFSCISGFRFETSHHMHWKLYPEGKTYPFLDIFFYNSDGRYLWAIAHYNSINFIYPNEWVFPLKQDVFEGRKVPVPREGLKIVRRIFDFDVCKTFHGHVKLDTIYSRSFPKAFDVLEVPCSELGYLYNLTHLTGN